MICPKCGNQASLRKNSCEYCGTDLQVYRKILQQSAQYYNRGLECAKVRDLSSAVIYLKKSLEFSKKNSYARNLLGLVYFEMGETVAAISEWVISKHFQPKDNPADTYMDIIQNNPVKLDVMNQAIRKYNLALEAAKQGTDDLAIIQLKKVVGMHPNFIRAMQLLALLYMKTNEPERAAKLLHRILAIDVANTTALSYLAEIERAVNGGTSLNPDAEPEENLYFTNNAPVFEEESHEEDKPNVMAFIGLIAGILIGIAVVFFLIVPGREDKIRAEYMAEEIDHSEVLNSKIAQINSLQTRNDALEIANEELSRNLQEAQTRVEYVAYENPVHAEFFVQMFDALSRYVEYMTDKKVKEAAKEDPDEALCLKTADVLLTVDISLTENQTAVQYFETMCSNVLPDAASYAYQEGKKQYDDGQYEDAVENLLKAHQYDTDYDRPIYYLGRSYQELQNREKAIYYFDLLLQTCPESSLSGYASERLKALRGTE